MSKRAPGKHYREGLSLIELTAMFSDDAQSREMVCCKSLAGWCTLPALQRR